ncbi:MAG: hypothetical protein E7347_05555 [Clostridiales bacterium]|nr:hypothetical protein [Clostridiales bacterium]
MASITTTVEKGKITANSEGMTLIVDDESDVAGVQNPVAFKAMLRGAGSINITFSPDSSAEPTVQNNGIHMIATVTVSKDADATQWKADDAVNDEDKTLVDILAPNEAIDPETEKPSNVIDLGTTKSAVISAEKIINALLFCGGKPVILDTYQKNQEFKAAMSKYTINITISEAV